MFTEVKALFALPPTEDDIALYRQCTGRTDWPTKPFKRIVLVNGRRTAKTFLGAAIITWAACFRDYSPYLTKGEKVTLFCLAADRKQARLCMRYISGFLSAPGLKQYLVKETAEAFELVGNVIIEVATASVSSTRGYSLGGIFGDEASWWNSNEGEGANPASEIFVALTPGLATIPGSITIIATTPGGKRSYVGEIYDACYGDNNNDHTLVWSAPSLVMNCTLDKAEIELAYRLDPAAAAAEWGGEFRHDEDQLVRDEIVGRATPAGVYERLYDPQFYYVAGIDMASGSGKDAASLAISHRENDVAILDLVREVRPPFSTDAVAVEFSDIMRRYGVSTAYSDRYALGWVEESFKRNSILIEYSDLDRSQIYSSFLPLINSDRIRLLDVKRLRDQLLGLTRYNSRVKEIIDHKKNQHDDIINAAALSLVKCVEQLTAVDYWRWLASPAGEARHQQNMLEQQMASGRPYLGGGMWG
ncbi:MAG: hypothetical protein ACLP4V_23965 [Methylocella sp.]